MYSRYRLAYKYLVYLLKASNGRGHGIHSPFVFEFITKVLRDRQQYPDYAGIEGLRSRLKSDDRIITVEDMGAGSARSGGSERRVSSIARHALKPKKFGQLLFRLARFYQPALLLELGTSLGITSAYLARACPDGKLYTLEGAAEVVKIARGNFSELQLENISIVEGNFDYTLDDLIGKLDGPVGLTFIDGNHRYTPTIQYFEKVLMKTDNFSMIILDDIHWSREMEEAWENCRNRTEVTLSIDLFFIGILFFRKEIKEKQHFVIRF